MNNFERGPNNPNVEENNSPEEARQTLLLRGKRIFELFRHHETENPPSENYLLAEHLAPSETPFGTPRSNSKKDRQFACGINGEECDTDEVLHRILTEGLTNLGDASSGAIYKDPDVSKTVSPCTNMLNTVINLKTSYKGSSGAVLVQIPIEYCNKEGKVKPGMENQVYDHNELGNSRIKPEFLVGFVTKPTQGKCEFKSREELLSSYENSRH